MRWAPLLPDGRLDPEAAVAVIHHSARKGVVDIIGDFLANAVDGETAAAVLGIVAGCYRLTFRATVTEEARARRIAWVEAETEMQHRAPALSTHAGVALKRTGRQWAADKLYRAANDMPWDQRATWPPANLSLTTTPEAA